MAHRRIVLGAVFLTGMAGLAQASPRDDMLAGISRCSGLSDERTFLDCVYGAAQPVRAELGLPPAPQSQTRLVPVAGRSPTAAAPAAAKTAPQPDQRGILDRIFASGTVVAPPQAMKSYSLDAGGYFTVTLTNGQVWRQVDGDRNLAHWDKRASDYVALVETGMGSDFNMEVTGEVGLYKVTRLR
jgi:hypothetical protein